MPARTFWPFLGPLLLLLAVTAQAGPGEGLLWREQHLRLSPYADLQAVYDSNVYRVGAERERLALEQQAQSGGSGVIFQRERKIGDTALESTVGVNLSQSFETFRWDLRGWGRLRRYLDTQDQNANEYGESLNLSLGERRTLLLGLTQTYTLVDSYNLAPFGSEASLPAENQTPYAGSVPRESQQLTRRALMGFGASVGRQVTDKLEADASYSYSATDNRNTGSANTNAALNNTTGQTLSGEVGWRVTDKSQLILTGSGGLEDSDGFIEPARTWAVRAGVDSRPAPKLSLRATAGVAGYSFSGAPINAETGQPPADSASLAGAQPVARTSSTNPSFELGINWAPTSRLAVSLAGQSGFSASALSSNNASANMSFSASLTYRMTDRLSLALYGVYQTSDYLNPVPVSVLAAGAASQGEPTLVDKYVRTYSLALRANYVTPAPFLTTFAEARNDVAESNDPLGSYSAIRVTLGVSARY